MGIIKPIPGSYYKHAHDYTQPQTVAMGNLLRAMGQAEADAWKALAAYKFYMFGQYAAQWIVINKLTGLRRPNPFRSLVHFAQGHIKATTHNQS